MPTVYDVWNQRTNPPWEYFTKFDRAEWADTTNHPDFYWGARFIGGHEGPWGNTDFLFTALTENTYPVSPLDYLYEVDNGGIRIDPADSSDVLFGSLGDDTLDGGAGDDLILAGVGADHLDGGAGRDTLSYFDAETGVTVKLYENTVSGDIAQLDTISGFEDVSGGHGNDWLFGSAEDNILDGCDGGDFLIGLGGNDLLRGGNGDDTLIADWGTDILEGGAGNDLFAIWNTTQHAIITDFNWNEDHIQFQKSWLGSIEDLYASATQQGSDLVIAKNGIQVTIKGVQFYDIWPDAFSFV